MVFVFVFVAVVVVVLSFCRFCRLWCPSSRCLRAARRGWTMIVMIARWVRTVLARAVWNHVLMRDEVSSSRVYAHAYIAFLCLHLRVVVGRSRRCDARREKDEWNARRGPTRNRDERTFHRDRHDGG